MRTVERSWKRKVGEDKISRPLIWKAGERLLLLVENRSLDEVLLIEKRLKFISCPVRFPNALKFSGGIIILTFLLEAFKMPSNFLFSI